MDESALLAQRIEEARKARDLKEKEQRKAIKQMRHNEPDGPIHLDNGDAEEKGSRLKHGRLQKNNKNKDGNEEHEEVPKDRKKIGGEPAPAERSETSLAPAKGTSFHRALPRSMPQSIFPFFRLILIIINWLHCNRVFITRFDGEMFWLS